MVYKISHQKATAIAKKHFDGALPKRGDGRMLQSGAKLRRSSYLGWCIVCYTYDPYGLELKPLGIIR